MQRPSVSVGVHPTGKSVSVLPFPNRSGIDLSPSADIGMGCSEWDSSQEPRLRVHATSNTFFDCASAMQENKLKFIKQNWHLS